MPLGLNHIASLVATGAAAAAIAAAPIATAAPAPTQPGPVATGPTATPNPTAVQQSCADLGATHTECQSPGNAQLNDSPPQVDFFPYAGGGT